MPQLFNFLRKEGRKEGRKEQEEIKPGTLREGGNSRCCIPCSFTLSDEGIMDCMKSPSTIFYSLLD